ncbi:hypothetical protein B0O99DRAFT_516152 [Bisporella sp. PMI_857]|nr:hypothetical protein B0O99DRAFT_516152 [Bisporella sp. PMI_857]
MSPSTTNSQPAARSKGTSRSDASSNPFNIVDEVEESDEEWWEDDDEAPINPLKRSSTRSTQLSRSGESASSVQPTKTLTRSNTRKIEKKYSVYKPTRHKSKGRQRKQNALAGIKVVTNFSKDPFKNATEQQAIQPQKPKPVQQVGRFVDLAALQALDPASTEGLGSFWKSRKNKQLKRDINTTGDTSGTHYQQGDVGADKAEVNLVNGNLGEPPSRPPELDLSPSDRPIVIGISVPSARLTEHSISPQTAVSDSSRGPRYNENRNPETPTIIITPAHTGSIWSALDDNTPVIPKPRPASSLYSISTQNAMGIYTPDNAPPMPQVPISVLESERQRIAAQRSYFSPDTEDGTSWEDDDPTERNVKSRSRSFSAGTVFEEDDSPLATRSARALSLSAGSGNDKRGSVNTIATRHRSRGWWNYITTPFLTRSNTVASRGVFEDQQPPAIPDLSNAVAAAKAQEADRDTKAWEKQFSPLTPATSTTINSDAWWEISAQEDQSKHHKFSAQLPDIQETRHKAQTSSGTIPLVLSETAELGGQTTLNLSSRVSSQWLDRSVSGASVGGSRFRGESVPLDSPSSRSGQRTNVPLQSPVDSPTMAQPTQRTMQASISPPAPVHILASPPPPPYSPAQTAIPLYQVVLPPVQLRVTQPLQYPSSPGPISPGLQRAMTSGGGIPMSEVPLTPASRGPSSHNPQYDDFRERNPSIFFDPPPTQPLSKKAQKAEAKRRRHEKEDAIAHKAGGLWRGRACIPKRGCYGRSGAEGRKRRRWYLGLTFAFLTIMIVAVVLATTLHRKPSEFVGPSQWLNLTGFPPIFTGLSTVAAPVNIKTNTGCIFPATVWSCDLPKELHGTVAPNPSNQPNFVLQIQWDNSSATNATFADIIGNPNLRRRAGNAVSAGQFVRDMLIRARQIVTFTPNPAPPLEAEGIFLGNTTDGIVSANKNGEPTPFYISLLSPTNSGLTKRYILERQTNPFPNVSEAIPKPSTDSDGTAAAANLVPFPLQQPIRLYDRGLPTEHYGFYTFFDRSIFLKSITSLDQSNSSPVPDDENGGSAKSEAQFRVTWAETRFLVQMWTRMNSTAKLNNGTISSAGNFTQPGTFPYPITLTIDRHGGDPTRKMLYRYEIDDRQRLLSTPESAKIMGENRGFGGTIINPAAKVFSNESDPSLGGFDGGTSGCSCQWSNFQKVIS